MEDVHDHCRSCYAKYCDFDMVQDISCRMISCMNECGQKLHECKQEDHKKVCLHQRVECINKQYGCPACFQRRFLSKHLDVCPANVQICTMEWNRWHSGSLISKSDNKSKTKRMQNTEVVSKDLDVASAIHDQRILLETIMPSNVLQYYSQIADHKRDDSYVGSCEKPTVTLPQSNVKLFPPKNNHYNDKKANCVVEEKNSDNDFENISSQKCQDENENAENILSGEKDKSTEINGLKCTNENLLKYVNIVKQRSKQTISEKTSDVTVTASQNLELLSSKNKIVVATSDEIDASALPYDGLFSRPSTSKTNVNIDVEQLVMEDNAGSSSSSTIEVFNNIDAYIQEFATSAPEFMSLLDTLDSDICIAIDIVDRLVNEVVKIVGDNGHNYQLPLIDWQEDEVEARSTAETENKCYELRKSISELLQEFGVVCELTIGSSTNTTQEEKRALRKAERKKRRSWLFNSNISTGGSVTSWGWMPKKEVKDVSTDTDDLCVDKTNLEWLSPEASVSSEDLIFRLFSILGASYRGYATLLYEKQLSPFISYSSCQTVAPFLLHIDMNAIGRALCSASLSSITQNPDERRQMMSLLTAGKSNENATDFELVKISDNLAFSNLALGSVMESLSRYQTKPSSMFSFMCGCLLRRDQFASHIQNVHCEIMSGLNGWIEQKCPYAAYGCEYTQPRFCPDHCDNAIIFNQTESSFAVRPGLWSKEADKLLDSSDSQNEFLNLPYEVHEMVFQYLDSFSIRQLSLSCSYLREVCREHLTSRGIVESKWEKRTYLDGTQSWKMGEKIWSFPPAFSRINRWVLPDNLPMVEHVSKCPVVAACDLKYKEEKVKVFF